MRRPKAAQLAPVSLLLLAGWIASAALGARSAAVGISGNGRYFVDSDGKPFFWQGDTEWELFHLFSVDDAKTLLLNRRKQGFSVIQVMVTGVYPEWRGSTGHPRTGKHKAENHTLMELR